MSLVDQVHGICHGCGRRRRLGRASRTCGACLVAAAQKAARIAKKQADEAAEPMEESA
jgi:hypothetical protein